MTREEKYPWFFDNSWENVDDFIDKQVLTSFRMKSALKIVHSGSSYAKASNGLNLSKQAVSQWLSNKGYLVDIGRLHIEIHAKDLQTD